jgi:hypothetical protein
LSALSAPAARRMQAHSDEDYDATDQQLPRGAAPREDAAVSSVSIVGISGIARIAPISDIFAQFLMVLHRASVRAGARFAALRISISAVRGARATGSSRAVLRR